jgi:hypothetical protein
MKVLEKFRRLVQVRAETGFSGQETKGKAFFT